MSWPILILASTVSAAIIIYTLWPTIPEKKNRKILTLLLTAAVFILPAGLKYALDEKPVAINADTGNIYAGLPKADQSVWTGELVESSTNAAQDMSMSAVTARLEEKLRRNPDDTSGWILLGRSYAALGNPEKAVRLFEEKMEENSENVNYLVSYGETLVRINQGIITEEAKILFLKAFIIDAENPRTGYNLALYEIQQEQYQRAYNRLSALLVNAPKNTPYSAQLKDKMALAVEKLGVAPKPQKRPPLSSPTPEQITTASDMSAEDRNAFINSMVNNLAAKLEENPEDLQGWLQLGKSYGVLGQWQKATQAYQRAIGLAPEDTSIKKLYDDAQTRAGQ